MNVITTKQQFVLLALFALLMAATRFHHFGSALFLPDASLAVFFLAGFYLSGGDGAGGAVAGGWFD